MRKRTFLLWMAISFYSFLLVVSASAYIGFKILPNYQKFSQNIVSNITGSKVLFHIDSTKWSGFNPVLKLSNISIETKKDKIKINLPKLTININIFKSIFFHRLITNGLNINKAIIVIKQPHRQASAKIEKSTLSKLNISNIVNNYTTKLYKNLGALRANKNITINQSKIIIIDKNKRKYFDFNFFWKNDKNLTANSYMTIKPISKTMSSVEFKFSIKYNPILDYFNINGYFSDPSNILLKFFQYKYRTKNLILLKANQIYFNSKIYINKIDHLNASMYSNSANLLFKKGNLDLSNISTSLSLKSSGDKIDLAIKYLNFSNNNNKYKYHKIRVNIVKSKVRVHLDKLSINKISPLIGQTQISWKRYIQYSGDIGNIVFGFNAENYSFDNLLINFNFKNLGLSKTNKYIDFSGLSGHFFWQNKNGVLNIVSKHFDLGKNFVFNHKWPVVGINLESTLVLKNNIFSIYLNGLKVLNPRFKFLLNGNITFPLNNINKIQADIKGSIDGTKLTTEYQSFLPKKWIENSLYDWLTLSLHSASSLTTSFHIKGQLNKIPFANHDGIFSIKSKIKNANISPYFGWGDATGVNGSININDELMTARATSGNISGASISNIDLKITNLAPNVTANLIINTKGKTTGQSFKRYVRDISLSSKNPDLKDYKDVMPQKQLLDSLKKVNLNGNIDFDTNYNFILGPSSQKNKNHIFGSMNFHNVKLHVDKPKISLTGINGQVKYDNLKLTAKDLKVNLQHGINTLLNGSINLDPSKNYKFNMSASGVVPLPLFSKDYIHKMNFIINSEGDMKAGFIKTSNNIIDENNKLTQKNNEFLFSAKWNTPISKIMKINYLGSMGKNDLSGDITLLTKKLLLKNINLNAKLNTLNPSWIKKLFFGNYLFKNSLFSFAEPKKQNINNKNNNNYLYSSKLQNLEPKLNVAINKLIVSPAYNINNLKISSEKHKDKIDFLASADYGQKLKLTVPYDQKQLFKINGANIYIPFKINAKPKEDIHSQIFADASFKKLSWLPNSIFNFNNLQIGELTIPEISATLNVLNDKIQINDITMKGKNTNLSANSTMSKTKGSIESKIDIKNAGSLFANTGRSGIVSAGSGYIKSKLHWTNKDLSIYGLNGNIDFSFKDGSILQINTGIAKYIGLLSVQSYLSLFSEKLPDSGFAFNNILGSYTLKKGIAKSKGYVTVSNSAYSLVASGDVDFNKNTIDQKISFQPHISEAASIIIGILGTPLAGIASYFSLKFLGATIFSNSGFVVYRVNGSIDNPDIHLSI